MRLLPRILSRLDIKSPNVVKGVNLEGLRVVGEPGELARRYYEAGIDEILYMDCVASLYQRNSLTDIVSRAAGEVFVPMTVGGGIRTLDDVKAVLRAGADKVAVNTAAIARPELVREVAERYGSQCMVVGIEAKRAEGGWEAYTDNGRERTGKDVLAWVQEVQDLGAGEILLTSVDMEGKAKGCDLELIRAVAARCRIPLIASGGVGEPAHAAQALEAGADAVALAHVLHYGKFSVQQVKDHLRAEGWRCR